MAIIDTVGIFARILVLSLALFGCGSSVSRTVSEAGAQPGEGSAEPSVAAPSLPSPITGDGYTVRFEETSAEERAKPDRTASKPSTLIVQGPVGCTVFVHGANCDRDINRLGKSGRAFWALDADAPWVAAIKCEHGLLSVDVPIIPADTTAVVTFNGAPLAEKYPAPPLTAKCIERVEKVIEQDTAVAKKEVASGRCTEERYNMLSRHVSEVRARAKKENLEFLGHDVVVAKPEGSELKVTDWLGGEVHFFALAIEPVEIGAVDARGYVVKTKSFFEPALAEGMIEGTLANWVGPESDSRVMQTQSGEKVSVIGVRGTGCTLIVALRKR